MKNQYDFEGYDVIPPKGPITLSIELNPEEVELAFASEGIVGQISYDHAGIELAPNLKYLM